MKFEEALIIAEERNGGDFLKFEVFYDIYQSFAYFHIQLLVAHQILYFFLRK